MSSASSVQKSRISRGIWTLSILAAMGGFLDSYDLISIGSATVIATQYHDLHLTTFYVSWLNAMAYIGAISAAMIGGWLSDRVGRRGIFVLDLILFVVAGLIQGIVTNTGELLVLRFLIGVAIGLDIPVAWTMICEAAPAKSRGRLVSLMFTFWALGGLVSFVVATLLLPLGSVSWRILLASSAIPAAVVFFLRRDMPESPRWLVSQNRPSEASVARMKLGADEIVVAASSSEVGSPQRSGFRELFGTFWRPTVFEGALMFVFSATGILVSLYPPRIFSTLGHVNFRESLYIGMLSWFVILLAMLTAVWIIDIVGRRPLALMGSLGVAVLLVILTLAPANDVGLFLALFLIFAFVEVLGAWATGWVYQSEIFPTRFRGTGAGYSGAMNRIGAGAAAFGVPIFLADFNLKSLLYVFAGLNLLLFIVLLILAVETKGLTLEAIENVMKRGRRTGDISAVESSSNLQP